MLKAMIFPVVMYGSENGPYREGWAPKNWCFWTVVLEKTLESPLYWNEIQSVHPKGNQSWIFIAKTDVEVETPILWPPAAKNWLIEKRPWFWERLKAGGEEDNRGCDIWMASPILCSWIWASSRSWWWTGMLQSLGWQSQTWQSNWTELNTWNYCNIVNQLYFNKENSATCLISSSRVCYCARHFSVCC